MTRFLMILGLAPAAATIGCASNTTNNAAATRQEMTVAAAYEPSSASALAFDPPMTLGQPMPSLARDGRAPAAFAGYEQQVTISSYTHQRDEIRVQNDSGQLDRRAYTDTTSITTR